MNRDTFVKKVDALVKLVRTEYGLTQEQMSQCRGISKKTLNGIEKGRWAQILRGNHRRGERCAASSLFLSVCSTFVLYEKENRRRSFCQRLFYSKLPFRKSVPVINQNPPIILQR